MSEQKEQKASYYEYVMAHDFIEYTRPMWSQGGFKLRESDGKLEGNPQMAIEGPWHYIKHKWDFDCFTWHHVIFDYLGKKAVLGKPFVPSECHQCFKVVVRPKTLKQLFALEALQTRLNRPSKCGIEVRDTVHGLYGGYFYNKGLEEGLARYKEVRKAIDEDPMLGWEVPVILKRGCTEFELACGPSDKWEISPEQLKLEQLIKQNLAHDDVERKQPDSVVKHCHRRWIEFAYAHGDSTYAEFTNGNPLTPPVVTYHHLAEEPSAPETGSPEAAAEVKEE
jgi:hypothetical protein